MKLVIDIPEKLYETIKSDEYGVHQGRIYDIIRSGAPLPKGLWRATDKEVKAWMYAPEPFKGEEDKLMRDCEHCEHYKDNGEARGCELWKCEKDGKDDNDDKEYDDFDRSGSEWR